MLPRRRNTVATIMRTSARSRSGSASRPGRVGVVERAVERPVAVQHFDERLRREAAGGKARHVRLRAGRGVHAGQLNPTVRVRGHAARDLGASAATRSTRPLSPIS